MNYARDIKDLSISMEALARIQGSDEYYSRIARLLDSRILQLEEQVLKEQHPLKISTTPTDEIPF